MVGAAVTDRFPLDSILLGVEEQSEKVVLGELGGSGSGSILVSGAREWLFIVQGGLL